jgi:hypothetical protein
VFLRLVLWVKAEILVEYLITRHTDVAMANVIKIIQYDYFLNGYRNTYGVVVLDYIGIN